MFDPSWDAGCEGCSMIVDNIGHLAHLHARDTSLVLVSRAPLPKLLAYQKRMDWTVPWNSSYNSDFTRDVSDDANAWVVEGDAVWLRISEVAEETYAFHSSLDGRRWEFVRYFALSGSDPMRYGIEVHWRFALPATRGRRSSSDTVKSLPVLRCASRSSVPP